MDAPARSGHVWKISPFTLNEASWGENLNSMRARLHGDWVLIGVKAHLARALH